MEIVEYPNAQQDLTVIYRLEIRRRIRFNDFNYPGMTIDEAVASEAVSARTSKDKREKILVDLAKELEYIPDEDISLTATVTSVMSRKVPNADSDPTTPLPASTGQEK